MKLWCVTFQMKAIEQYFHLVMFIMLYKTHLTFKCVDKSLSCVTIQLNAIYTTVIKCYLSKAKIEKVTKDCIPYLNN